MWHKQQKQVRYISVAARKAWHPIWRCWEVASLWVERDRLYSRHLPSFWRVPASGYLDLQCVVLPSVSSSHFALVGAHQG